MNGNGGLPSSANGAGSCVHGDSAAPLFLRLQTQKLSLQYTLTLQSQQIKYIYLYVDVPERAVDTFSLFAYTYIFDRNG